MDYTLLDNLTCLRSTLYAEARRNAYDAAYLDLLYREWLHVTRRIETEWRRNEGSGIVPTHLRSGREGRDSAARERRTA